MKNRILIALLLVGIIPSGYAMDAMDNLQIAENSSEDEAQSSFDSDAQDSYEEQDSSDEDELGITDAEFQKIIQEEEQYRLERRHKVILELFVAIEGSSRNPDYVAEIERSIAAGADVNAPLASFGGCRGVASLGYAMFIGNAKVCRLLLDHGADMSMKLYDGGTVSTVLSLIAPSSDTKHQNVVKECIKNACFNPYYNGDNLQESKEHMLLALWALKHAKPCLPKDVCNLIFQSDPELWQDFCSSPIGLLHAGRYERIPCMPFPVIRALINAKKFKPNRAVGTLVGHTYKRLKPLMEHACQFAQTDAMKAILNPNALDDQFGEEIEQNIRTRLGIQEMDEELENPCLICMGRDANMKAPCCGQEVCNRCWAKPVKTGDYEVAGQVVHNIQRKACPFCRADVKK